MNGIMRAAAQVIARARDVLSETGRPCHGCPQYDDNVGVVPDKEFQALLEAVDDYDTLCDLQDMDDTLASVGGDLKRDVLRGA